MPVSLKKNRGSWKEQEREVETKLRKVAYLTITRNVCLDVEVHNPRKTGAYDEVS